MKQRIKEICDFVSRGTTPNYVDYSPYKVMNQATFSKGWLDESNVRYTQMANEKSQIKKGDLLMASTGGGVLGKVYYFDQEAANFYADSHVSILRNSKGTNSMKFLYYIFSIKYDEINATMVKGSTNQTELQRNYLLNYELDMPDIKKQKEIVAYLDDKLEDINKKVYILNKKQEVYLQLKKSLIYKTVFRGLNPSAAMKDTGIEWIGNIPKHWRVMRIKDIGKLKLGKMLTSNYQNGLYLRKYLKARNIGWGRVILDNIDEMYFTDSELKDLKIKKGDLLFTEGGDVGKTCIWKEEIEDCYIQNSVQKLTVYKNFESRYYLYLSMTYGANKYYDSIVNLVSIKHLTNEKLRAVKVLVPPYEEQVSIANYLDEKCLKIDTIVEKISQEVKLLDKLKKSLINEVITGKRTV